MSQVLQKLGDLLKATYNNDESLRKAAEAELFALAGSPKEYFLNLIQLLSSSEFDSQQRSAAAISVKNLSKSVCESSTVTSELRLFYATHIFKVLTSVGLESPVRNSLSFGLAPFFSGQTDVISAFLPILTASLTPSAFNIIGSIKTIKAIYSGFTHNPVLLPFFKKILQGLIDVLNFSIQTLNSAIFANNQQLAFEYSEIIYEWACMITSIFEYFDISSKPSLGEFKNEGELASALKAIVKIGTLDCIVDFNQNTISIKLMQAKTQTFQTLNIFIQYLSEYRRKIIEEENQDKVITHIGLDMPDSPFLNTVFELIPDFILSLETISYNENSDSLLEIENVSEFYNEVLTILSKIIPDNRFSGYFNDNYKHIITNICLPLLKSTLTDIEVFEESPEEFVTLSADICERQESETIKSAVAQVIENLCMKIDGSLKFLIDITREIIEWTVTRNEMANYPVISEFSGARILKTSEELRVETAFLSICIVSFAVGKRSDLVKIVEQTLQNNIQALYTGGTGLIKNRVCMLIRYCVQFLFLENDEEIKTLLLIILEFCNPKVHNIAALNIQASETLSFMLQEEEVMARIYGYFPEIIVKLLDIVECQTNKAFFESLQEIISSNPSLVLPYLSYLIPQLVNKVKNETIAKKSKKNKTSIIIIKCWNIIRTLIECKSLSKEQILLLEEEFTPLFEYIKSPKEIEFDDDILMFEVTVMRRCESVSQVAWTIFSQLPLIQEKYEGTFVQLFQILNCYIFYGFNFFVQNKNYLATVTEMCGKALFATCKNKVNEATNAEAALIYHQLLLTFKGLMDEFLPAIFEKVLLRLSANINNDFFKARLFGVVLSALAYNANLTVNILNSVRQTYFDELFTEISKNCFVFAHAYDKKVAVLGLVALFSCPSLVNHYVLAFQMLIEILGQSWQDNLLLPGLKINEQSTINSIKEQLKEFSSEEMEATLGLTAYLTPLEKVDEYDYFRTFLNNLQKSDFQVFVKALNQGQVQRLTKIVQSKRVQVGEAHTDVRIKKKPKYNNRIE